ncbi:Zn-ribbon domain-containing OB-fold protein [Streptomyces sp. NPDC057638]|uniref:Zn-ribbon domain-containing OB-fold protein n=1 Tax=Streptomyces sp. NPDC057638 TaxID=3346190 RepID=UPI0036BBCC84
MFQSGTGTASQVREEAGVTYEGAGATALLYQRCRWCATVCFRRLLCPVCSSSELESAPSEGDGVVLRSAVVHRQGRGPRNESLVRFPEGFVFRCQVIGVAPQLVWVGARVRLAPGGDPYAGEVVLELCDDRGLADWR